MGKRGDLGERSEKEIQNESLKLLISHPSVICCFQPTAGITAASRFRGIGSSRPKGISDLVGMFRGGRFFAIEFKKPGGKLSPEQIEFLKKIEREGGLVFVAYSTEEVLAWLKQVNLQLSSLWPI